ncbi:MAG TPA: class I SAM-dependent methyltransferase [Oscillatoriales cyanobacterium M59_W2019_021]|nr:MAG: class I SAM-dependent methyltransferase [Cyanobacteria bacterium J055]HIK30717.1 class I SAM-dependent methyltransferase [Oscillatoriales cyanobacterium M4454_W2019_049]HIK51903.1 class I SAM-dependent methyltransferase [Oscillatoriales cyanobacterium M59_W2019_021]
MTNFPHPELCQSIRQFIQESPQQRITFAEYMSQVLYHPQYGYYTRGAGIGALGDFATSPHLCADFGETLAEQFLEMWHILDRPNPFHLVEMGAGQGILARDILQYIRDRDADFYRSLDYIIIETSATFQQEQQRRFKNAPIRWCTWDELPLESIVGCCFSNELVDAFPVHLFAIESGNLREIYVANSDNDREFVEILGEPSTSELAEYLEFNGIEIQNYPDGYRSEINLAALDWMETVAKRLKRGYVLTIDYGYTADRYYSLGRSRGTLQCYYQHRYHDNPYLYIGNQDITAHVNFTALQRQGEACGLSTLGLTQQGLFLMALGWGDRLVKLSNPAAGEKTATARDIAEIMQRRQTLHALIDPMGLGGFQVLIQGKGLSEGECQRLPRGLTELSA